MHMCVWAYVLVRASDWGSEGGAGSPGDEVTGSGETLHTDIGSQMQVLCKSIMLS